MKFAILGGSFNPPHNGHVKLAESALSLGYDRIIFVPAYQSPLKPAGQPESALARAEMVFASISGDRRFTVDFCEIEREGVSYTIDTIGSVTSRYVPEGKTGVILGDDVAVDFGKWKDCDKIARDSSILIANRNFGAVDFSFPHVRMHNEVFSLSSERVRQTIKEGGAWRSLVPKGVQEFIEAHRLYSGDGYAAAAAASENAPRYCPPPAFPCPAAAVENWARRVLSLYRFAHSRNVALHCADLAARFKIDADEAYLAGLVHDICKEMSLAGMLSLAQKDGRPLSLEEEASPALLHGRAAAVFIEEQLGIHHKGIIEAVRVHTIGGKNIGELAKIVYCADKIEAGRRDVDPELRAMAFGADSCKDSDELYAAVQKLLHVRASRR